jgi:hypothetical protein
MEATLSHTAGFDSLHCLIMGSQAPPTSSWFGSLPQWVSAGAAVAALGLAGVSARWAAAQWRLQHFTTEWGKTVAFLYDKAQFLNPEANKEYKIKFKDDAFRQYELVARFSISYVDDLFHLGMGSHLKNWLRGSVQLFVAPHQQWFEDHEAAYSKDFVTTMKKTLESLK